MIRMEEDSKIVLYGAGTQNLRMVYQPLASAGYKIHFICDQDCSKQGDKFFEAEIVAPSRLYELDKREKTEVIITVRTESTINDIKEQLKCLRQAQIYTFDEFVDRKRLNNFVQRFSCIMFHLTDHCNLSCVRCSHYSPLAKEEYFLTEESFERDCKRLSELTGGDVDEIQFSGGEPLLHPKAHVFPYIARKFFPSTKLIFITNATKIREKGKEFIDSCRENQVDIWISKYPIGLQYDEIERELLSQGIKVTYGNTGNSSDKPKQMWGLPLKVEGGLDVKDNFDHCLLMQYIVRNGYMYPCANSAYIDLFNSYFGQKLPGPMENGINIYEVQSLRELCERVSKPIPLCAYCDSKNRRKPIPWCASHKTMEEWSI